MLTLFTTPKPFQGHINIIQRNALKSWTLLHPDVEVILFGDDEGAAEVAAELRIRHEPFAQRHESGMKYLDYIFDRGQELAQREVVCYANCDIILTPDFSRAVERVRAARRRFLLVGHRWDADISAPVDFSDPEWASKVQRTAAEANDRKNEWFIDYFCFPRGLYSGQVPPLLIGRTWWDNFLLWKARDLGASVVDASTMFRAVHQNHDYGYHPKGRDGVWSDELSKRNSDLAGGGKNVCNLLDVTARLTRGGRLRPVRFRRRRWQIKNWAATTTAWRAWEKIWYRLLDLTYDTRHSTGLTRQGFARARARLGK